MLAKLDQFIFGEDVQLGDVTGSFFVIAVVGPDASGIVSGIVGCPLSEIDALAQHANRRGSFRGWRGDRDARHRYGRGRL